MYLYGLCRRIKLLNSRDDEMKNKTLVSLLLLAFMFGCSTATVVRVPVVTVPIERYESVPILLTNVDKKMVIDTISEMGVRYGVSSKFGYNVSTGVVTGHLGITNHKEYFRSCVAEKARVGLSMVLREVGRNSIRITTRANYQRLYGKKIPCYTTGLLENTINSRIWDEINSQVPQGAKPTTYNNRQLYFYN